MTNLQPTDAMSPVGDAKQATDDEIQIVENQVYNGMTFCDNSIVKRILSRLSAAEARNAELERENLALEEQLSEADAAIQREGKNAYEAGNQDGYKEGFRDAEREYRRD